MDDHKDDATGSAPRPTSRPRIRPYVLTGGRTRSSGRDLPLEAIVVSAPLREPLAPSTGMEVRRIVNLCRTPMSIAEIAARMSVPLGVARVLVSDMTATGLVTVGNPSQRSDGDNVAILERLLNGIRAL